MDVQGIPESGVLSPHGDVDGQLRQLEEQGLDWWFAMDIPRIAHYFQALQQALPSTGLPASPRRDFLRGVITPVSDHESYLQQLSVAYQAALDSGDTLLVAAIAGAGCGAVWDSGYDFRRFDTWLARITALLDMTPPLPPLARASLLGFKANAEMNGHGDLAVVTETCHQQMLAAEAAHSTSLRIFHVVLKTYCYLWQGQLSRAGLLLQDAGYLCGQGDAALIPQVFLRGGEGLYHTINGDAETGRRGLEATVAQPGFDQLPPSLWLLVQANLLFAIANCDDHLALEAVAARIQQRVVPQQNAFHHSFVHFSLGIAALGLGQPQQALAHAEQAISRGEAAYSAVTARMPVLLKLQALADLGRDEEALALAEQWLPRWQAGGFCTIAVTAALEIVQLALQRDDRPLAEDWYLRARAIMPTGEALVMFHRAPRVLAALRRAMNPGETPAGSALRLIRIYCLGGLRIEVGDTVIHGRSWRGERAKALLKALVVHGGRKVDAALLVDLLWPDAEGDQASRNLKVLVWRLRRLGLGPGEQPLPWLVARHGHLTLADEYCAVDVFGFEAELHHALHQPIPDWAQLHQALAGYTGDFLPTDNSETWIIEHRERLRRRFIEAVLVLADIAPDAASREESMACLQRALDIDPLDERLYQRLMQLNLALGYPARALETYHAAQQALQRGLAIAPGTVLVELARQAGGEHL